MAARARTGFQIVVWFAAANFAALVVAALAALATGALNLERLGGAARVLGGGSEAVPVSELEALREARAKLEGRRDEAELMKARASLLAREAAFDKRSTDERRMINDLRVAAERAREESTKARNALKADRDVSGAGRRRRSTLPLVVFGSESISTKADGIM